MQKIYMEKANWYEMKRILVYTFILLIIVWALQIATFRGVTGRLNTMQQKTTDTNYTLRGLAQHNLAQTELMYQCIDYRLLHKYYAQRDAGLKQQGLPPLAYDSETKEFRFYGKK